MTRDTVSEMQRRRSFYKTTSIVQSPFSIDISSRNRTPIRNETGRNSCICGDSGFCDRCAIEITPMKSFHRKKFNQTVCEKCYEDTREEES